MSQPGPPVPGMDVLVPPLALCLGVLVGIAVYRDAIRSGIPHPGLWSGFAAATFVLAPLVLRPFLRRVYYSLFIPPGPGLLAKPVHALVTILGGGAVVGGGAVLLYGAYSSRFSRRKRDGGRSGA